jgi:hypothetical protein
MKRDPKTIAREIISLVSQLAALAGPHTDDARKQMTPSGLQKKGKTGPVGGVRFLIQDGKLDSPKSSAEIIELLKQEGRHYPRKTVLVGLLRLVRERALTRLKENGEENWKYVIRR